MSKHGTNHSQEFHTSPTANETRSSAHKREEHSPGHDTRHDGHAPAHDKHPSGHNPRTATARRLASPLCSGLHERGPQTARRH